MRINGRRRRTPAAFAALTMLAGLTTVLTPSAVASGAADNLPSVRLVSSSDHARLTKYQGSGMVLSQSTFVAADDAPFEIWAQRARYSDPVTFSQVVRDKTGEVRLQQPLDAPAVAKFDHGIPNFVRLTLRTPYGTVATQQNIDYCPNTYQPQRINDAGPADPTFSQMCRSNPFTLGMVLGIDQGWASPLPIRFNRDHRVPDGSYTLHVDVRPRYRSAFSIPRADATMSIDVNVVTQSYRFRAADAPAKASLPDQTRLSTAPLTVPGAAALPDMASLPAWGMSVNNRRTGRSFLNFGATVWNAGPSPLVVEGFREAQAETMKAYQYFYENGERVGRAFTGRLEYDHSDGHDHWHFRDFARYSLLAADKVELVRSSKEAFCLAPTDMVDTTVPGASLRPWLEGLDTACGEANSLWIREALAAGWGDTYTQYRPGQSFNITNLPNGKYFIEVRANPDGRLYEGTQKNNVALRAVRLRGTIGERRVIVRDYQGIDTELRGSCGQFC